MSIELENLLVSSSTYFIGGLVIGFWVVIVF